VTLLLLLVSSELPDGDPEVGHSRGGDQSGEGDVKGEEGRSESEPARKGKGKGGELCFCFDERKGGREGERTNHPAMWNHLACPVMMWST